MAKSNSLSLVGLGKILTEEKDHQKPIEGEPKRKGLGQILVEEDNLYYVEPKSTSYPGHYPELSEEEAKKIQNSMNSVLNKLEKTVGPDAKAEPNVATPPPPPTDPEPKPEPEAPKFKQVTKIDFGKVQKKI